MPKPVGQVTISVLSAKSVAGAATSLDPCASFYCLFQQQNNVTGNSFKGCFCVIFHKFAIRLKNGCFTSQ